MDIPPEDNLSGRREEEEFARAKSLGQLSAVELSHYTQERLLAYTNAQLEVVRRERDDAEDERDRLRDQAIGKWFGFFGGGHGDCRCADYKIPQVRNYGLGGTRLWSSRWMCGARDPIQRDSE